MIVLGLESGSSSLDGEPIRVVVASRWGFFLRVSPGSMPPKRGGSSSGLAWVRLEEVRMPAVCKPSDVVSFKRVAVLKAADYQADRISE